MNSSSIFREFTNVLNMRTNMPADIGEIVKLIPVLKSLHTSFWEDPVFLNWQITRMNRCYQEHSMSFWRSLDKGDLVKYLDFFFIDFSPGRGETFDEWKDRLEGDSYFYIERLLTWLYRHDHPGPGISFPQESFPGYPRP